MTAQQRCLMPNTDTHMPDTKHSSPNRMLQQVADRLNRLLHRPTATVAGREAPAPPDEPVSPSRAVRHRNGTAFSAEALRSYVMEHLDESSLSIEQWASHLGCCRTGLYTAVREAFGTTPLEYITQCRLQRAIELLSMGTKASTVAKRCGFDDPKYFGKMFKKRYGMLPSRYFDSLGSQAEDRSHASEQD